MKTARIILSCIMMLAVLSTGMPQRNPADLNGDGATDLADAVLGLKKFQQSSENPLHFSSAISEMLTTLHIVAGFKSVIKTEQPRGDHANLNQMNWYGPMTIFSFNLSPVQSNSEIYRGYPYQSVKITPPTPPPVSQKLC